MGETGTLNFRSIGNTPKKISATPKSSSSSFFLKNQRGTVHKLKEVSRFQNENFSKDIKVNFVDGSSTTVKIYVSTTAEDAVEKIAQNIKLQNYLDFRLFLIDEYNNQKMIDEDELLFKLFSEDEAFQRIKWEFDSLKTNKIKSLQKEKQQNMFNQMKKKLSHYFSLTRLFSKEKELKLLFKKYFFLDQKLEKEGKFLIHS